MPSDFPTLDGPAAFLVMMGVLLAGVTGAVALIACVAAMTVARWRPSATRAFIVGLLGSLIAVCGAGLCALGLPESGITPVVLTTWLPLAALIGFGFGALGCCAYAQSSDRKQDR
jgi:hypothetical protein